MHLNMTFQSQKCGDVLASSKSHKSLLGIETILTVRRPQRRRTSKSHKSLLGIETSLKEQMLSTHRRSFQISQIPIRG